MDLKTFKNYVQSAPRSGNELQGFNVVIPESVVMDFIDGLEKRRRSKKTLSLNKKIVIGAEPE